VTYDRAGSAMAEIQPGMVDWDGVFAGAGWCHWTGITPALSASAAAVTKEAVEAARRAGARISVDLNFRKKLWNETQAQAAMRPLMPLVDVVIANEEDLQSVLGIEVPQADVTAGQLSTEGYRAAAQAVVDHFGVQQVAVTLRESFSASENAWSAVLLDAAAGAFHQSQRYVVTLVDRIGGGDSFAGGLIYGLATGKSTLDALRFAVAASALKQSIPGDFNRVSVSEVERLVAGDASGRVQR
jgi:2-dehydro-3-deoxygluconokinase